MSEQWNAQNITFCQSDKVPHKYDLMKQRAQEHAFKTVMENHVNNPNQVIMVKDEEGLGIFRHPYTVAWGDTEQECYALLGYEDFDDAYDINVDTPIVPPPSDDDPCEPDEIDELAFAAEHVVRTALEQGCPNPVLREAIFNLGKWLLLFEE